MPAGRAEPPLRVTRMRAEGKILEIGPSDLALTAQEASALLRAAEVILGEDEVASGAVATAPGRRTCPSWGVLAMAVIAPTAGRWYIGVSSGVPPKQFIRGEWFVSIAALTGAVWLICDAAGLGTWWSVGISFVIGFTVRLLALYQGWEEPLAKEPAGVYQHSDGRLLGRKIAGKSQRELHDLGLAVENPAPGEDS